MSFIEWNDSLSVNVAEIDNQHQKLVAMVNELNDAMKQGQGKQILGKILDGLSSYTVSHFKTEEKYFDLYGYPETAAHKKEHNDFFNKVLDFKAGFEKGELSVSFEVMMFLSDWIKNHIKGSDKKYSAFFNDKGLE